MEALKTLLGEELFAQVSSKLGDKKLMFDDGGHIPKTRLDEVIAQRDTYKGQVDETASKIKELEKAAKGNDDLLKQIEGLNEAKANAEKAVADVALKSAIKLQAVKAKAKDPDDLLKFVDASKLTLEGDTVKGLDEMFKELSKNKAYLFEAETPPPAPGANPPGGPQGIEKVAADFKAALG